MDRATLVYIHMLAQRTYIMYGRAVGSGHCSNWQQLIKKGWTAAICCAAQVMNLAHRGVAGRAMRMLLLHCSVLTGLGCTLLHGLGRPWLHIHRQLHTQAFTLLKFRFVGGVVDGLLSPPACLKVLYAFSRPLCCSRLVSGCCILMFWPALARACRALSLSSTGQHCLCLWAALHFPYSAARGGEGGGAGSIACRVSTSAGKAVSLSSAWCHVCGHICSTRNMVHFLGCLLCVSVS